RSREPTRMDGHSPTLSSMTSSRLPMAKKEVGMHTQRDFLLLVTLAAAAASVTAAFGQAVTPAVGPTGSFAQSAASIPDVSGMWTHPYLPGFEPPASGPGPVTNRSRKNG